MSFDPKCYELAVAFLAGEIGMPTEEDQRDLAQVIQDVVDDWLNFRQENLIGMGRRSSGDTP